MISLGTSVFLEAKRSSMMEDNPWGDYRLFAPLKDTAITMELDKHTSLPFVPLYMTKLKQHPSYRLQDIATVMKLKEHAKAYMDTKMKVCELYKIAAYPASFDRSACSPRNK